MSISGILCSERGAERSFCLADGGRRVIDIVRLMRYSMIRESWNQIKDC